MEEAVTDEALCENMSAALESAEQIQTQIEEFYRDHKSDRDEYVRKPMRFWKTSQKAEALKGIEEIDKKFSELYESESDLVAMDTAKNDRLFREAQQELWKIPSEYPENAASMMRLWRESPRSGIIRMTTGIMRPVR